MSCTRKDFKTKMSFKKHLWRDLIYSGSPGLSFGGLVFYVNAKPTFNISIQYDTYPA